MESRYIDCRSMEARESAGILFIEGSKPFSWIRFLVGAMIAALVVAPIAGWLVFPAWLRFAEIVALALAIGIYCGRGGDDRLEELIRSRN